jgi:prepilin-type N-terminal cleavage/methylation domain-containing protein
VACRRAFTFVELVVVVIVLGILVAMAALKQLGLTGTATDNGLKGTLTVVRDAIELYAAQHDGELPGASNNTEAAFKADLEAYLRGPFPKCPVGPAQNDQVKIRTNPGDINGENTPTDGWYYSVVTGKFICNYKGISKDGLTPYDEF